MYSSAPGKVILFGEHAVVHGSHAVAASLTSLRIHAMVEARSDGRICLDFEDVGERWECATSALGIAAKRTEVPVVPLATGPRQEVLERVKRAALAEGWSSTAAVAAAYLCAELCDVNGVTMVVKSAGLPLGAGLGSSAAFCVSVAAVLCAHRNERDEETVNNWAFSAEVVCHGTPSGLDNAVCCFGGGALALKTSQGLRRTRLDLPSNLSLLVTDTKKPRKTSRLVAKVTDLLKRMDSPVRRIFDAIDAISLGFADICAKNETNFSPDKTRLVADYMRFNHGLLRALNVSDALLEIVADIADSHDAAATKLTGAGGGGCAITLLHHSTTLDRLSQSQIDNLRKHLRRQGFDTYQTELGGNGLEVSHEPL